MARHSNSHGGIYDMDLWYYRINARMHWVDVDMIIDTMVLSIGKV
jgi:hypothetical protein